MERSRRKLNPIARKRHNYVYFLLSILAAIVTGYIFFNFPPDYNIDLSQYNITFQIPITPVFFLSFYLFVFSFITFILIKKIQGILFVVFILGYIGMRQIGLTHWIFLVLLLALFITIELFLFKKK